MSWYEDVEAVSSSLLRRSKRSRPGEGPLEKPSEALCKSSRKRCRSTPAWTSSGLNGSNYNHNNHRYIIYIILYIYIINDHRFVLDVSLRLMRFRRRVRWPLLLTWCKQHTRSIRNDMQRDRKQCNAINAKPWGEQGRRNRNPRNKAKQSIVPRHIHKTRR